MKPAHKSLIIWHLLAAAYYLSSSLCTCSQSEKDIRLVDLTHVFDNRTIYWVTEPTLTLNITHNGTFPGADFWYQKDVISAATHGGTHLDAPSHFAKHGWCVSDIPLERLVVPAVVIDISAEVNGNPEVHLNTSRLLEWEQKHGTIPNGSLLLINTGWAKFWPDPLTYSGTDERKIELLRYPSIKAEVAEWLVSNRNVVGVGLDTMSLDVPNARPDVHITLMEKNIYGLENVNNLHLLPPTGAVVFVMPMNLKDASGAPCRIVAQISETASSGSVWSTLNPNVVTIVVATLGVLILSLL